MVIRWFLIGILAGIFLAVFIMCVLPLMSKYIDTDELTEELEKQREIKEDCEYTKGINAMLDTAKGKKQINNREYDEIVCHCNLKENAEIIAKILDYDIEEKIAEYRLLWDVCGNDIAEQKFKDLTNTDYDKTEICKAKEKEIIDDFSKSFENKGEQNDTGSL